MSARTGTGPLLLHSMATPESDAVGCLEIAARLGLDGIELIIHDGYPSAVPPQASAAALAALRGRAEALGLRIAAVVPYDRGLTADNARERSATADGLRRAVDIAAALGAAHVRVLAGTAVSDNAFAEAIEIAARTLAPVAVHAAGTGVSLNIENHMDTMATTAERTRALANAVPGVGILYDQANLTLMSAEPAGKAIQIQQPLIRHVHVKNHVPTATDRTPVALAHGVVPWRDVVRGLLRSGYRGGYTFEYERRWYPDALPPPVTGLTADRDLLRALIEEERPT